MGRLEHFLYALGFKWYLCSLSTLMIHADHHLWLILTPRRPCGSLPSQLWVQLHKKVHKSSFLFVRRKCSILILGADSFADSPFMFLGVYIHLESTSLVPRFLSTNPGYASMGLYIPGMWMLFAEKNLQNKKLNCTNIMQGQWIF